MILDKLPKISVVVPTRNRPKELAELLQTILNQDYLPLEVIIVDDSPKYSAKNVAGLYSLNFKSVGCNLKYVSGSGAGLPAARNLGVQVAKGEVILFLDDDTLLPDKNVLRIMAEFLGKNIDVLGVQPLILSKNDSITRNKLTNKLENAIYKVLMLTYHKDNTLAIRRSGESIYPNSLSKIIRAQRLSGCCCGYRREIFKQFKFDRNLKRWGFMEDLDFSYRVYKKNPKSLCVIPYAKIVHKHTTEGRLATKTTIYMSTIYWFYIFFKDIFERSTLNLVAFIWALMGNLIATTGGLILKRKPKREWWNFIWLLNAYVVAFKNLRNILRGNLEFFNKTLVGQG
jgi:glycosyltransferase involved in cell wall biosynthesis